MLGASTGGQRVYRQTFRETAGVHKEILFETRSRFIPNLTGPYCPAKVWFQLTRNGTTINCPTLHGWTPSALCWLDRTISESNVHEAQSYQSAC